MPKVQGLEPTRLQVLSVRVISIEVWQVRRVVLALLCAASLACLPIVQNVTNDIHVPSDVTASIPAEAQVLVLPVWYDNGPCNVRTSFVLSVQSVVDLNNEIPKRRRFGILDGQAHAVALSLDRGGVLNT